MDGRDLDTLSKRSAAFAKALAKYYDANGIRYRIDYGLWDEGNVEMRGEGHTRLAASWKIMANYDGCLPEDAGKKIDAMFSKAKLNKLMHYDGWEGPCDGVVRGDDPKLWPTWYWYERKHTAKWDDRVEGKDRIETYAFKPRRGSKGVSLEPPRYMKDIRKKLAKNPGATADLIRRLKF